MADQVSLHVRFIINLRTIAIRTSTGSTVAEFKLLVALHFDVPVDRQRLFHNNRELRDYQTIESYGLQDGHVVYLLRRSHPSTSSASTSMAAAATSLGGNGAPHIASKLDSFQNQEFGSGNSASLSSGLDGSSDATGPGLLINVQDSSETRFSIRVRPELTVGEFKGLITQLQDIPVNEQRLIYCGQFLQDDKTIGSYGVQDGHVMQLARRLVPVAAAPPVGGNSIADILNGAGSAQSQGVEGGASSLFGYVLPGFEQLEQPISDNLNMVIGMTTIPAIQNLLDDPRISRIIIVNNVWILESMDPDPEVVYIFKNPGAFRLTMETIRNLEQIREMVRDSTMSNTESLPEGSEGSNMLRQRYENVHEPLPNALPNPWDVNAGLGIPGLSGLDAQSSSFIDPASRIQALQYPATFGIRDEVIHNDPQSSSLFDFNPQVLDAFQNPETSMSQLASHRRLQQSQVFFASPLGSSMSPYSPFGTGQTAGGSAEQYEEYRVNQLLSMLNGMGFIDNCANLRALIATSGNIGAAVVLLRNLGR